MQLWYMIFTPENAEYVEDIPILNNAMMDLKEWEVQAMLTLASRGFSRL